MPFKFTTCTTTVRARGILRVNRRGTDDPCPGELHLLGVESLHVLLSNLGHGEGQTLLGLDAGVGHLLRGTSVNFNGSTHPARCGPPPFTRLFSKPLATNASDRVRHVYMPRVTTP